MAMRSLLTGLLPVLASTMCIHAQSRLEFLDDRFELPPGFRIYRAAERELTGGSYDLAFDGEGRLLVGDGTAIRRLTDTNRDGVFDRFEVIATGLGWRGPQGLLVDGDRLYAVGGDGIQLYEGYRSAGQLVHRGRLGRPFKTGGDHDAHTVLRGFDGYIYFMSGNGAGNEDRQHITEKTSPVRFEREATVFRFSPDGQSWEAIASGGRNPPNLGLNYLGELFSLDSDMEWHVSLPWYRPVTLNHWTAGGDQGWRNVGAYPRYYLDSLPGVLEIGRGSPNWGIFYEHFQFPQKYHDAYLVCDYRWKMASSAEYASAGRLLAFFLKRSGAGWTATMEVLAQPRPGAKDADGRPIHFALVDIDVAPDGSVFVSDHNQGIWRILFDPEKKLSAENEPIIAPPWPTPSPKPLLLTELLTLPQPGSEWSRVREEMIRGVLGSGLTTQLQAAALNSKHTMQLRLRAIRLIAPDFKQLDIGFIGKLATAPEAEIRAQAAWLLGIMDNPAAIVWTKRLLRDQDGFVRRRAVEAAIRTSSQLVPELIERLSDAERLVAYTAMIALTHLPTTGWLQQALSKPTLRTSARALTAAVLRRERLNASVVRSAFDLFLTERNLSNQDQLDVLRLFGLCEKQIAEDSNLQRRVRDYLVAGFSDRSRDVRFEQIRLLGMFQATNSFAHLVDLLVSEQDPVMQFHTAQSIGKLRSGWAAGDEERLASWLIQNQAGWFGDLDGKGVEFPLFWSAVLADFGAHHGPALLRRMNEVRLTSQLGSIVIDLLVKAGQPAQRFITMYSQQEHPESKVKLIRALKHVPSAEGAAFLRAEYRRTADPEIRSACLASLISQAPDPANEPFLLDGLRHSDPDVVHATTQAIGRNSVTLDATTANLLISQLAEHRGLVHFIERTLNRLTGITRPGFQQNGQEYRRADEPTRMAAADFWKRWYEERFKQKFESLLGPVLEEKPDETIHRFVVGESIDLGRPDRGQKVYERIQCNRCHGGGVTPGQEGRIFGPDLIGVTRRLTRIELADALVYPSKQVQDRFKGTEIELKDGRVLTGFVTEQTEEAVTLVDREAVHKLNRGSVQAMRPQSASLMPDRLLNQLAWDEIRDLLAFLNSMGTR